MKAKGKTEKTARKDTRGKTLKVKVEEVSIEEFHRSRAAAAPQGERTAWEASQEAEKTGTVIKVQRIPDPEIKAKAGSYNSSKPTAWEAIKAAEGSPEFKQRILGRIRNEIDALEREVITYRRFFKHPVAFTKAIQSAKKSI